MNTTPTPSEAVELIWLTPSIDSTRSSTFWMIPSSTSSGDAPGYSTRTCTAPRSKSGNTSTTTADMLNTPAARMKIISRLAATGCAAIHAIARFTRSRLPPGGRSSRRSRWPSG